MALEIKLQMEHCMTVIHRAESTSTSLVILPILSTTDNYTCVRVCFSVCACVCFCSQRSAVVLSRVGCYESGGML